MRALQSIGGAARLRAAGSRRMTVRATIEERSTAALGSKVEKWLRTPFDIAAFGARLGAGALVSFPDKIQSLPQDVEKVTLLVQDPRPLEEKGTVLLQEVEDTLVELLERGSTIETDVLSNVKSFLPAEVVDQLDQIIPKPPTQDNVYSNGYTYEPSTVVVEPEPVPTYTAESVAASQVAAEVVELKRSVLNLKAALESISSSTDPTQARVLRLNLQEARDQLERSLQEAGAGLSQSSDPSVAAAAREAQLFLTEVDAQFFPSSSTPSADQV